MFFVGTVALYTAAAAVSDFRTRRVPNWLTLPAALGGLAFHTLAPQGWGLTTSLAGMALGFALLLVPFLLGGGGMGDVKLLAALGAWLGPRLMLAAFAMSMLLATFITLGILAYVAVRRHVLDVEPESVSASGETIVRPTGYFRQALPFAVPLALGTWLLLAWMIAPH
jgi:prepilin peptidase CpaA